MLSSSPHAASRGRAVVMTPTSPQTGAERADRRMAIVAFAAVSAFGSDLLLPLPPGLTVPLYTAAVLVAAVLAGAVPGLVMAIGCTVALVVAHGAETGDAALIGTTALFLGSAFVGRVVDRLRARAAHLEHIVGVLRRESRPISIDTVPDEPDPVPAPAEQPRRPTTGNLPRLLYRYARLLNVTDEDAIYTGLALTLEEVLPAERVAVYAIDDGQPRLAAGERLPPPPVEVAIRGATPIFTRDDDVDTVFGRVRAGADGPVTAVIVVREPGRARRPEALKLLATFLEWASASVGHAQALDRLDVGQQVESARLAEARGRATARAFAETGSIPLLLPDDPSVDIVLGPRRPRAPRPAPAAVFDPEPAPSPVDMSNDDTERIAPQAIAGAFAEELAERRRADSLPFDPVRPLFDGRPTPDRATAIDPPGAALAAMRPAGGPSDTGHDPSVDAASAEHIAGDVRAAIERMARRLANSPPSSSSSSGSWDGSAEEPPIAEIEGLSHGRIDDDMVAAEELPLIGGPGLGVAAELGRSPVNDRFAHLLADLSDHLDGEGESGR